MDEQRLLSIMNRAADLYWSEHCRGDAENMEEARTYVARLIRENQGLAIERRHLRLVNERLIRLISAIHMRCAPPDTKLEDGRTMRFVPPDPEFYWRELSAKVNSVMNEMKVIDEAEDTAACAAAWGEK